MLPWIRRLLTLLVVAAATAGGALWWLYDGDLRQGVAPVVEDVAEGIDAGIEPETPGNDQRTGP